MRILVDVDAVVADLMKGFAEWLLERHGIVFDPGLITVHRLSMCPVQRQIHPGIDFDSYLRDFLAVDDVYQVWVTPIPGAVRAVTRLLQLGNEVGFVTATMRTAPSSHGAKRAWLDCYFPTIPMLDVQADQKHWVSGDVAIDDRFDTCMRWERAGVRTLMFRQPWNEAPEGTPSYDWQEILDELTT